MDRPLSNQTMRSKHLAQSFSALPFQSMRPSGNERLSESCNGKINTEPTGDPELTNLNWLSCLTPQSLGGPIYDVDNIASNEEILGSSMNSSSTEQSDVSQNLSHSAENPCIPVSPLGQDYQRFLEERKRSEGESRRFTQPNPVVMNPTSIMCNTSSQQQYSKPPLSFGALICLAIESSPRRKLPVREIYMWIEGNFPFYKNAPGMSWKNSVRHNLSLSKAFVKIPRDLPGNPKSNDNCNCGTKTGATPVNRSGSPHGDVCQCGKTDEEGGKGCLWGINDDYRNSLIASFRRSGLSYPLIFPLGGVPNEEKAGDDRSLPEYYSQAALEQQQYPPGLNNVAHQQVIPQNANLGPSHHQAFQQFQMFQHRQRQRMGQKRAVEDGDENHQQTLLRDLRFFNQAIKRTQALMFKESIDEGEEEEEEEELKDVENDNSNDVLEEIPLESHGLTSEQIAELNHLARRGRRKKTRTIRHMTPCPSLDHDYCKVTLCTEDLFESETDEEAAVEEPQRPPPIVRRPRLSHSLSALHTARKRLQERSGRHKQLSWLGIRRPSFHSRALARSLQAEAVPRAAVSSGLPRRRRPGRPPKNRSNLVEREELERERRRRRKRETDSGSLADDEELDDALTEPMIDSDEEMEVDMDNEETEQQELNIDDIQAADILTKLKLNRMNFNHSMIAPNGGFPAMSLTGNNQPARKEESLSEDDHPGRDSARSPENIPPASVPGPKRRGRKPRNDPSRLESLEKMEKSKPLAPKASLHDPNEDHVCSRSGLPKRQAAVNAPAVWKRKAKKMNK